MGNYLALIDLGSNTARLVIYYDDGQGVIREEDNVKRTLRLISYLDENRRITTTGFEKTLECMHQFKDVCTAWNIQHIVGVATAAVRQAQNGHELLQAIEDATGISIRLLSGEEEAHYGYLAVVNSMNVEDAITVDIGGGSTELTRISQRRCVGRISLPFGAVSLTQWFLNDSGIPPANDWKRLFDYLKQQFGSIDWLERQRCPVIAMGGTARNLAKIVQRQSQYSLSSLHHYEIQRKDIDSVFTSLSQLSIEQRKQVPGLAKDRADVIVSGIAVFRALLEAAQSDTLITSNKGLRDGILFEQVLQKENRSRIDDVAMHSVGQLMRRYRVNIPHANHVRFLAMQLFDDMKQLQLIPYGNFERRILEIASLLHNIGLAINVYETSQHTFYMLSNILILGLTHRERILIATVAAYKNQKQFQKQLAQFPDILRKEDKQIVEKLGHIVLLARILDRSMTQQIKSVRIKEKNKQLVIECYSAEENLMEFSFIPEMLEKLSKLWKLSFQYKVVGERKRAL
ncbi:Ppx/GppA family phosphatase [Fodinisporobacter ferrooxydans]|uniref:Ppx/GppA family phosphatase n=1 Tax=Fodinisporobacter ferrooxydans TaxID=2901836 RepID=A0ABY4CL92_9BACL|nr:Ppx/GppA family phosphatase [Alicyclobacillaceae bacterium MYW30-H2]